MSVRHARDACKQFVWLGLILDAANAVNRFNSKQRRLMCDDFFCLNMRDMLEFTSMSVAEITGD